MEAFLESAPQLILQCAIILLTGNASESQINVKTANIKCLIFTAYCKDCTKCSDSSQSKYCNITL